MQNKLSLALLLLCVFFVSLMPVAMAAVECDGADDIIRTAVDVSPTFFSMTTGSMTLWYKPMGTASSVGGACTQGELLIGDIDPGGVGFGWLGMYRNGNFTGGLDRFCAHNAEDDDVQDTIVVAYTINVWAHLAWVHTGGNLSFYKDGVLVSTIASGTTNAGIEFYDPDLTMCGGNTPFIEYGQGVFTGVHVFATALSASEIANMGMSRVHNMHTAVATGSWDFGQCDNGANCNTVAFVDRSGNGRSFTADDGLNNTGMTGRAEDLITYPWGPE